MNKQLEPEDQKFDPKATACVFLGTPHRGSPLTFAGTLLSLLGFWSGSRIGLLQAIEPNSIQNDDLHKSFMNSYSDTRERLVNFYEVVPEYLGPFPLIPVRSCGQSSAHIV